MPELHEKHRPVNFDQMIGNEHIKSVLIPKIENDELPQAIMFTGERGCGKSTLSRFIPILYNASYVQEVNIGVNTGVDFIRNLLSSIRLSPLRPKGESKRRFYILNEYHMASAQAQNALLEDSEKPPKNVYFIICTTDPQKIVKTIKSRFMTFEVKPLTGSEIMDLLGLVCRKEEKTNISLRVLRKIVKVSEGIPREALILLNKVIDIEDEEEALEAVVKEEEDSDVRDICMALGDRKIRDPWPTVQSKLYKFKGDAEQARNAIAGWFTAILLNPKSDEVSINRATIILPYFSESVFHYTGKPALAFACRAACVELKG